MFLCVIVHVYRVFFFVFFCECGVYINNSNSVTLNGRVFVSAARPIVTVNPQNQTFSTGDEVRLKCSAKGYPAPTVVWTHNDMFITGSSR